MSTSAKGYLPGPMSLQSAAAVGISTTDYDLTGYAADQLGDVESIPAGWEGFLQDATVLLDGPEDPLGGFDLNHSISVISNYTDPESLLNVNDLISGLGDANTGLADAIGFAPVEAWTDPPTPFTPPQPVGKLPVPLIPPDQLSVNVVGTVAGSVSGPGLINPTFSNSVTLTNTTSFSNSTFRVGDGFQVTITGNPGRSVFVWGVHDGEDTGGSEVGTIGADGKLVITGQMGPDNVGAWEESWSIGSSQVAVIDFVVLDAS